MTGWIRKWRAPGMDKALNYLSLGRRGSLVELGEEPVGAAARAGKAYLVVVASDASDHTWRRGLSFVAGTTQQCLHVPFTKDELGLATGRQSLAIAAFTDAALAVAFVKALGPGSRNEQALAVLEEKAARLKKRRQEASAHKRNVRTGKKK